MTVAEVAGQTVRVEVVLFITVMAPEAPQLPRPAVAQGEPEGVAETSRMLPIAGSLTPLLLVQTPGAACHDVEASGHAWSAQDHIGYNSILVAVGELKMRPVVKFLYGV